MTDANEFVIADVVLGSKQVLITQKNQEEEETKEGDKTVIKAVMRDACSGLSLDSELVLTPLEENQEVSMVFKEPSKLLFTIASRTNPSGCPNREVNKVLLFELSITAGYIALTQPIELFKFDKPQCAFVHCTKVTNNKASLYVFYSSVWDGQTSISSVELDLTKMVMHTKIQPQILQNYLLGKISHNEKKLIPEIFKLYNINRNENPELIVCLNNAVFLRCKDCDVYLDLILTNPIEKTNFFSLVVADE